MLFECELISWQSLKLGLKNIIYNIIYLNILVMLTKPISKGSVAFEHTDHFML